MPPEITAETVAEIKAALEAGAWKCPKCGASDTWFDRMMCEDGPSGDYGMHNRCSGCGTALD
jgi:predicted RNA-binding Zn-ribbon protein involved in translation (DUF1610 family)